MSKLGRRGFLGTALGVAASLRLKAKDPQDKFPTGARERLSVSTYPFRSVIASPHPHRHAAASSGVSLQDFAKTILPKFNVPGIEPWSPHFESTDQSYVEMLRDAFRGAGLHVVNIPVDVGVKLCGTAEERASGLATYRKWVDAAVILDSPSIRVHLPHGEKGNEISCAVSALGELAQYGASRNIVINIENDDSETEQPERIVEVLNQVNSPFLRSLPDFCNSMLIHDDAKFNDQALSELFPLAFNISHVKDSEQDENKTYRVNVADIFAIAKKSGYRGYFSMEWEGGKGEDPFEGTRKLIAQSLKNLS